MHGPLELVVPEFIFGTGIWDMALGVIGSHKMQNFKFRAHMKLGVNFGHRVLSAYSAKKDLWHGLTPKIIHSTSLSRNM